MDGGWTRLALTVLVWTPLLGGCPGTLGEIRDLPPLNAEDLVDVSGTIYLEFENAVMPLGNVVQNAGRMRCRTGGAECLATFPLEARLTYALVRDATNESMALACEAVPSCKTTAAIIVGPDGTYSVASLLRGTYRVTVTGIGATATERQCTPDSEFFRIGQPPTTLIRVLDQPGVVDLHVQMGCSCRYLTTEERPYTCRECTSPVVACEIGP